MKIGYADPPYIGCAHLYKDHPDFAGEVDHAALIERLESEFDGWVLHRATGRRMRNTRCSVVCPNRISMFNFYPYCYGSRVICITK